MKPVKILPPKSPSHFVEESQDLPIFMCYASKIKKGVFQKLHHMAICRDYFGDALASEESKREVSIFGFKWGPNVDRKLDRDKTRFAFKHEIKETFENFEKNLPILNKIEKNNSLSPTIFFRAEKKNEILIEGDSKWMSSIFLISLYTYLLKCMCYQIKDKSNWDQCIIDHGTRESQYLDKRRKLFLKIIDNLSKFGYDKDSKNVKVHGYPQDPEYNFAEIVHNNSGWVSLCDGTCLNEDNYYYDVIKQLRMKLQA